MNRNLEYTVYFASNKSFIVGYHHFPNTFLWASTASSGDTTTIKVLINEFFSACVQLVYSKSLIFISIHIPMILDDGTA